MSDVTVAAPTSGLQAQSRHMTLELSPGVEPGDASSQAMEAWYMDDSEEDQREPHRLVPNQPVSPDRLRELGVFHWKVS